MFRFCLLLLAFSAIDAHEYVECLADSLNSYLEQKNAGNPEAESCLDDIPNIIKVDGNSQFYMFCMCEKKDYPHLPREYDLGISTSEVIGNFTKRLDWLKVTALEQKQVRAADRDMGDGSFYSNYEWNLVTSTPGDPISCTLNQWIEKDEAGEDKLVGLKMDCYGCSWRTKTGRCANG